MTIFKVTEQAVTVEKQKAWPGLLVGTMAMLAVHGAAAQQPGLPDELAGTAWQLVSFQSMDDAIGTITPVNPAAFTLELGADGSAAMQLDCNRGRSNWSAQAAGDGSSGTFSMGPLAVTRALCPPPNLDEKIARDAGFMRGYLLRDGNLYLSLMADAGIYAWEPVSDESGIPVAGQEDGGPRVWQVSGVSSVLNMREQPSQAASVIARLPPGQLLDNLGCEAAGSRIWCDVQKLGGGERGYVAADFLAPAVAADGTIPTGYDDSAMRAGMQEYDATGELPCAQTRGQPMNQCAFGVARGGGGDATVTVTRTDGTTRILFFHFGRFNGADTSQADGYPDASSEKEGDLFMIRVGDERYEVPEAVIFGG